MTITRKAEYAISALVALAQAGGGGSSFVSSSLIAEQRGIPSNLIAPTIARLRRVGWVETQRGAAGGVRLAADPVMISVRQVIETIDGPLGITRCLTGDGQCDDSEHCPLRMVWQQAQSSMLAVFDEVSIADLAAAKQRQGQPAAGAPS